VSGTAQHRPGLDLMPVTIPAYALYGIEALPADVVVGAKERSGRGARDRPDPGSHQADAE